jgi:hypothetical protein
MHTISLWYTLPLLLDVRAPVHSLVVLTPSVHCIALCICALNTCCIQTDGKAVYPGSGGTADHTHASTAKSNSANGASSSSSVSGASDIVQVYYTPRSNVLNLPQDTKVHPAGFHRYAYAWVCLCN